MDIVNELAQTDARRYAGSAVGPGGMVEHNSAGQGGTTSTHMRNNLRRVIDEPGPEPMYPGRMSPVPPCPLL
eukprot:COSAG02_NODE_532_length_20668_cov_28.281832_4_plen_72_part_00